MKNVILNPYGVRKKIKEIGENFFAKEKPKLAEEMEYPGEDTEEYTYKLICKIKRIKKRFFGLFGKFVTIEEERVLLEVRISYDYSSNRRAEPEFAIFFDKLLSKETKDAIRKNLEI
jgi:hypothetical protein